MNKKYELTEEKIYFWGRTLYRIKALKGFGSIEEGELGGYVESEKNLSHLGNCWIYGNAKVYDDARVRNDAKVYDDAIIRNNAEIRDYAIVSGNAIVLNYAIVSGNAIVLNYAIVRGDGIVCDNAIVRDNAKVSNNAEIRDYAIVSDNAKVCNNAEVCDNARVGGNVYIKENAYITSPNDFLCVGQLGSRNDYTTFYLDKDKNIWVSCGCFNGTIEEFKEAVEETHGDNKYGKQYSLAIEFSRKHFELQRGE